MQEEVTEQRRQDSALGDSAQKGSDPFFNTLFVRYGSWTLRSPFRSQHFRLNTLFVRYGSGTKGHSRPSVSNRSQYLIRQVWVRDRGGAGGVAGGDVSIPYSSGMGPGLWRIFTVVDPPWSQYLIRQVWVRDFPTSFTSSELGLNTLFVRYGSGTVPVNGSIQAVGLNTLFVRYGSGTFIDPLDEYPQCLNTLFVRYGSGTVSSTGYRSASTSQYLIRQVWVRDGEPLSHRARLEVSIPYSSGMGPGLCHGLLRRPFRGLNTLFVRYGSGTVVVWYENPYSIWELSRIAL